MPACWVAEISRDGSAVLLCVAVSRTRLKATAMGALLLAATSAAYSSAQLSTERWSRDILRGQQTAFVVAAGHAVPRKSQPCIGPGVHQ